MIVPQPLTIRVPVTGYPTPVAKWTFGEKELSADERVSVVTKPMFAELTITPSMRPDKGTYTLQLENDVSSVSGEIEVNVIGMKRMSFFKLRYNTHIIIHPAASNPNKHTWLSRVQPLLMAPFFSQHAPVLPKTLRWLKYPDTMST